MRLVLRKYSRFTIWIILCVVMTGAALHRAGRFKELTYYNTSLDIGSFYTEEAIQYRHTRMVADNEAIPLFDKKVQWPEGIMPFRELTLFQEYLHGLSFRLFSALFGDVALYRFLIYFISFFSALSVLAMFLGIRVLGGGPWPALYVSGLYAFSGAAYGRIQFYELEVTAFPLITLAFAACLRAMRIRRQSFFFAVLSGILLAAALICWHFTRFYLLMFWAAMAGAFLMTGGNRQHLSVSVVMLLSVAAVGVVSPVMRNCALLFSPAVMAGVVVTAGLYLENKIPSKFIYRLAVLTAGVFLIIIVASLGDENSAYGHVWNLLKFKLINLLIKPDDPTGLPFEGRILWNGPFNTPSPYFLLYRYGLLLPLAGFGIFRFIKTRRRTAGFAEVMVVLLAILFMAANVMVQRLTIFGAFFVGLTVVYVFPAHRKETSDTGPAPPGAISLLKQIRFSWILLAICLIFQVREALLWDGTFLAHTAKRLIADKSRPRLTVFAIDDINMLEWIRHHTPETAVFLSNIENSPSILTYTGRAINQHPKMEAENIRKKHEDTLLTLFGEDEEALYRLLDAYETDYYLYPIRNLLQADPDGKRYLAGLSKVSRRNLTYRLHFEPDGFRRLRLVYRNRSYQIFQVVDQKADNRDSDEYVAPYFPVYDEKLFRVPGKPPGGNFDDTQVKIVMKRINYSIQTMREAEQWLSLGDQRMALKLIGQALTIGLPDGEAYYRAADGLLWLENPDRALVCIRMALAYDPQNRKYKEMLTRILTILGEM